MGTAVHTFDSAQNARAASTRLGSSYIVGPLYDGLFFIFAPLLAVLFAIAVATGWLPQPMAGHTGIESDKRFWAFVVYAVFTEGHLVLAFFRSHLNARVFRQYPLRFTLIPALVFFAGAVSAWALIVMAVVAVWWDVYHSSMQTFGFARIYDAKVGNDATAGRRLDFWLNLVIYVGPILAGPRSWPTSSTSTSSRTSARRPSPMCPSISTPTRAISARRW